MDHCLLATGSEVSLALEVAARLEGLGRKARVVSMPCWEIFDMQDGGYRESILGGRGCRVISMEAGVAEGWWKYTGRDGIHVSVESFGLSAPAGDLAEEFGFTADSILERILRE